MRVIVINGRQSGARSEATTSMITALGREWGRAARPSGYVRLPDDWRNTIRLVNLSIPMSSCSRRSISS